MGGQAHQQLFFLGEMEAKYGIECIQDPSSLAPVVLVEICSCAVVDESAQQRRQMEDLLMSTAHRRQRVIAAKANSDLGVDV